MVKEDIETSIDRLLDYIHRAGKVPLGDAAAAIGRPVNQVERLALLLEEKGLLEVHYDITGVKISAPKEEDGEGRQKQEKEGKGGGPPPASGVIEEGRELEREVMTSESLLKFFEKDLERRIIRADKMLGLLEKSEYTKEELEETAKEVELAIKQLEAFEKEIVELTQKGESFRQKLLGFKQKLSKIQPVAPAKQAETRQLKDKLSRIIAEILAFLEFLKQDLKKLVPKPGAKQALPKISEAQVNKGDEKKVGKKEEFPPMAVQAEPKIEKAHRVELIRGGKPVITITGGANPLVTIPFVQQPIKEPAEKESQRGIPFVQQPIKEPAEKESQRGGRHPEAESQLARAVVSLEKIAQVVIGGGHSGNAEARGPAERLKAVQSREEEKNSNKQALKRRAKRRPHVKHEAMRAHRRKSKNGGKWVKVRVVRVRRDGRKQHYWVLKKV